MQIHCRVLGGFFAIGQEGGIEYRFLHAEVAADHFEELVKITATGRIVQKGLGSHTDVSRTSQEQEAVKTHA